MMPTSAHRLAANRGGKQFAQACSALQMAGSGETVLVACATEEGALSMWSLLEGMAPDEVLDRIRLAFPGKNDAGEVVPVPFSKPHGGAHK